MKVKWQSKERIIYYFFFFWEEKERIMFNQIEHDCIKLLINVVKINFLFYFLDSVIFFKNNWLQLCNSFISQYKYTTIIKHLYQTGPKCLGFRFYQSYRNGNQRWGGVVSLERETVFWSALQRICKLSK